MQDKKWRELKEFGEKYQEKMLKHLGLDEWLIVKGKFKAFDIIGTKQEQTITYEVKTHKSPFARVPYELFNWYELNLVGIMATKADWWIDVLHINNGITVVANRPSNIRKYILENRDNSEKVKYQKGGYKCFNSLALISTKEVLEFSEIKFDL